MGAIALQCSDYSEHWLNVSHEQSEIVKIKEAFSFLCTYDLYSPVHNALDACIGIHYEGKWEGLGPGNRDFFNPVK